MTLMKMAFRHSFLSDGVYLPLQVGNLTRDRNYWGRPERANFPRPVVSLTSTRPGTDVVAMTSAALAAASIAIREESSQVILESKVNNKLLTTGQHDHPMHYCHCCTSASTSTAQRFALEIQFQACQAGRTRKQDMETTSQQLWNLCC